MVLALGMWRALGNSVSITSLRTLPARDRWSMAGAAVANTILNLSVFIAFTRIGITLSLLIFYLYPAFVALASVAWFGDRLDGLRWSALAMSMVGIVLVVAGAGQIGELDVIGMGLALLGALGQTFYVMAARHGFARVPGAQAAFLTMAGAAAIYVVLAVLFGAGRHPAAAPGQRCRLLAGAAGGRHRRRRPNLPVHHRHPPAGRAAGRHPVDFRTGGGRGAGDRPARRAARTVAARWAGP